MFGYALVAVQACGVAAFAALEYIGLRRSTGSRAEVALSERTRTE
jgi:hypothetical protein